MQPSIRSSPSQASLLETRSGRAKASSNSPGKVYSFEPHPLHYEAPIQHLRLNRVLARTEVFALALFGEDGEVAFDETAGSAARISLAGRTLVGAM